MSFIRRLFSSDRRSALRAEATGDFELAAQQYALAGDSDAVVRMHLALAQRAGTRAQEVDSLRDAVHWARDHEELRAQAQKQLARALLAQTKAEGVATERDRERIHEAATLLESAQLFAEAGEVFLSIDETKEAIAAFRSGGLVAKLEHALNQDQQESERGRTERQEFADYRMHLQGGARDLALACLRRCIESAEKISEYRRLADDLESRLATEGSLHLRTRKGQALHLCGCSEVFLGRDTSSHLMLRSNGISRRHASIVLLQEDDSSSFALRDLGSRNGTRLSGMPIQGSLPLAGTGTFQLGESVEIHFEVIEQALHLQIKDGLDRGGELWSTFEGETLSLSPLGTSALVQFRQGRPLLRHPEGPITLNDEPIAQGHVQLIVGDQLLLDGVEIEVV